MTLLLIHSVMASFVVQTPYPLPLLQRCHFLGDTNNLCHSLKIPKLPTSSSSSCIKAKFNLFEVMGGRGLCNGEEGLQELLNTPPTQADSPPAANTSTNQQQNPSTATGFEVGENAFDKELLGLTGGFPGGEKGLQSFLDKNPPPPPPKTKSSSSSSSGGEKELPYPKSQPPQLPLLMPGMIAIVKNPNHPFYMYCGIIQRITDGKAGVLFEGGNWDKLITFRLDELERRDKGPPMVNPKSAVLENLVQNE